MKRRKIKTLSVTLLLISTTVSSVFAEDIKDQTINEIERSIEYETKMNTNNPQTSDDAGGGQVYYNPYGQEITDDNSGLSKYGPETKDTMTDDEYKKFYERLEEEKDKLEKEENEKEVAEKKRQGTVFTTATIVIISAVVVSILLIILIFRKINKRAELKKKAEMEKHTEFIDNIDTSSNNVDFDFDWYMNYDPSRDTNQNANETEIIDGLESDDGEFDYNEYINKPKNKNDGKDSFFDFKKYLDQ